MEDKQSLSSARLSGRLSCTLIVQAQEQQLLIRCGRRRASSSRVRGAAMVKTVGKYQVGKTLGEGTFGKVKFALNTESEEAVAIKVLDKERIQQHASPG